MSRSWQESIFPLGIPLAWRQLVSEPKRFLAAVAGIAVAVILMLFQIGLYDALFVTAVRHQAAMNGDIAILSKNYSFLLRSGTFTQRRLAQAAADPAVESTASIYLMEATWRNPQTGSSREIFVMGCRPDERAFEFSCVEKQPDVLKSADEIFFDGESQSEYGPIIPWLRDRGEVATEVNQTAVRVKGLFSMGSTFAADSTLLMGDLAFFRLAPHFPREMVSLGLVRLKSGHDPDETARRLQSVLPDDVRVVTRSGFLGIERDYWARRTPIGFVISACLVVGILVGGVIIYQILYADVSDHLAEYATLKGIGFSDGYFLKMILQQSFILSVAGFVPGVLLSAGLFHMTARMTNLPTHLSLGRAAIVFLLAVAMCAIGGSLAARKLKSANPADLF
jgi:putative ABC transport system permease protein